MPSCGRFPSVITSIFRRYGIPPSLPSFTRAPNIAANPARIIWPTDYAAPTHGIAAMAQPALDAVWLTGRRRYRTYSPILRILLRLIHSLIKSGCLNMQPLRLAAPFLSLQGVNFRDLRCRNFSMFQDIALLRRGAARARDHGPTVTVSSRRINRRSGPSFPLVFLRIERDVTKQSREG